MKIGKEIGITPIKGINVRNSCKEIEELLYYINDKLYFFSTLYISNKVKEYILEEIEKTGNKLKNLSLSIGSKSIEKKKELLDILRKKYSEISKYNDYDENKYQEKKMNSYLVAIYLKEKKENLSEENKIKWIRKIKFFSDFYCISNTLESVQNELLDSFKVFKSF